MQMKGLGCSNAMQCSAIQPVLFEVVVTTLITTPIATPGTQEPPSNQKVLTGGVL